MANPIATITVNNNKTIKVELRPDQAPNTVNNFIALANSGYYDGLIFHRVIRDFMIQGGCPNGTGMGGAGYNIKGEFGDNGHRNTISHKRGAISMARAQSNNSASSQFFIVHKDAFFLDDKYATFGNVIEGIEVVDAIADEYTDRQDKPYENQTINSIRVDCQGIEYPAPVKC